MNRNQIILLVCSLGLMGASAAGLGWLSTHQRLGKPGILTSPVPGSPRLTIHLPEHVLDYRSEQVVLPTNLYIYLPQDTSFAQRRYISPDDFQVLLNVVLMGTDRTSIHKPEFCLEGSGCVIDQARTSQATVSMTNPQPYQLPVMKFYTKRMIPADGKVYQRSGVYVFWFVADNHLTASHKQRMWSMAAQLLKTGVLERWAYIATFSECWPGQEEDTYRRMEKFIQAAAPQFQLVPPPREIRAALAETGPVR